MKKQIFSLMLSAAFFTTHPAFCMKTDREEFDESGPWILCKLLPEMQTIVFKELDDKSISSIACASKYENELIKKNKIEIKLNAFYKDWERPYRYEEAIRKVDFSVHIMTSGDQQKQYYYKIGVDLSFNLQQDQPEEKKEVKISFLPSNEKLKLLVKGQSKNLTHTFPRIFLLDGGYINFDNRAKVDPVKKSEIVEGENFNLEIQPAVADYTEEGDNWHPTEPTLEIKYTLCKTKEKNFFEQAESRK